MHAEFYTTVAQVIPVFLLGLMWESAYLDRLRTERRPARGGGVPGYFWTKPRVRVFILSVTTAVMLALLVDVLVLVGVVSDTVLVRSVVVAGLVIVMGTLFFRIWVDVVRATRPDVPDGEP
ncbi:hypothetical protein [Frankia sp. Cas3]|uniref:hypothetical protein n=1 Tax=Frankia sp. Cas3 TaxID=3073926 RepID=UPI002AD218F8|nr:hypothetical protein [Frankia sp. Cas3]